MRQAGNPKRFLGFAGDTDPSKIDLNMVKKYRLYLSRYSDPQTGKPWTTDMLDGAQIGVIAIDAAPDVLVSTLWALVDYGEKITSPIRNRLRPAIFTPGLAR